MKAPQKGLNLHCLEVTLRSWENDDPTVQPVRQQRRQCSPWLTHQEEGSKRVQNTGKLNFFNHGKGLSGDKGQSSVHMRT